MISSSPPSLFSFLSFSFMVFEESARWLKSPPWNNEATSFGLRCVFSPVIAAVLSLLKRERSWSICSSVSLCLSHFFSQHLLNKVISYRMDGRKMENLIYFFLLALRSSHQIIFASLTMYAPKFCLGSNSLFTQEITRHRALQNVMRKVMEGQYCNFFKQHFKSTWAHALWWS